MKHLIKNSWLNICLLIFSFVTLTTFDLVAADYIPPAGSPLAQKQHPRIFLTQSQLPQIRQYIQTNYASEFQTFINIMDGAYNETPASKDRNQMLFDGLNYGFLYLMDPAIMSNFSFAHSREQYRVKALEHALYIATDHSMRDGHNSGSIFYPGKGGFVNLTVSALYDWLFPTLSLSEKQQIADDLIWRFENRDSNSNPGEIIQLSNHELAFNHVSAGGLAFWGDNLGATYDSKAQLMLNHYRDMYIDRVFDMATHVFEGTSGWGEGHNYFFLSYHIIAYMANASGPALGINWFKECSLLHYAPYYIYFHLDPYPFEGLHYFGRSDDVNYAKMQNHGETIIYSHAIGALKNDDPAVAAFGKWAITEAGLGVTLDDDIRLLGLMYFFLNGYKEIPAQTPEQLNVPKSIRLGLGETVLRSNFTDNSTRIVFWTPKYFLLPHAHYDNASFTIDKFGPIALDAGNAKSDRSSIPKTQSTRSTIYHNALCVYHPDDDFLGFNGMWQQLTVNENTDTPWDQSYQEGGDNHVGNLSGMDVVGGSYDYIDYDYSRSFIGDGRVSQARRQLLYFRAPDENNPNDQEFLVINDRMNTSNTTFEKRWLLHMGFEPELVDGSWTSVAAGMWESTDGSILKISNTHSNYHGRLFVKTLFPDNYKLVKIGGPGHWFDDAEGRDMYDSGPYTDLGAAWCGSYRTEVRPTDVSNFHEMLHVIQIGDANTMNTMAPVTKISGANYVATLINQNRFALFSNTENKVSNVEYTINSAQNVVHVIGDLTPYAEVTVKKNGTVIHTGNALEGGSLHFTDNPGGQATYHVSVVGTGLDEGNINDTPQSFELFPNYPNPFNPSTNIRYSVAELGPVKIKIYDLTGKLVQTVTNEIHNVGTYSVQWNGRNILGEQVPSGMYLVSMKARNFTATTKSLLIR